MNRSAICSDFERLRAEIQSFLALQASRHQQLSGALRQVAAAIRDASLPVSLPAPLRLAGFRHAEAAYAMAESGPMADLVSAFKRLEPNLRWIRSEHYREQLGDDYMDNYCYTNILGFDALIPHDRIVATFFIIGPGRHYPRHHHEAEEVYFPFGGDTLWGQGDEAPRTRSAGEPIHNTPWLPHEMITRTTPLFTFCFWISPGPIRAAQLTS